MRVRDKRLDPIMCSCVYMRKCCICGAPIGREQEPVQEGFTSHVYCSACRVDDEEGDA